MRNPKADILYSVGTDEHGLKVQQAAAKADVDPQRFCDSISNSFKVIKKDQKKEFLRNNRMLGIIQTIECLEFAFHSNDRSEALQSSRESVDSDIQ